MFTKKLLYTVVSMLAVIGSLRAQNEGYSVGTPQGSLSVSEMGAAVYNLNIEVPNGGPLTPQIGIAYNSQMSGYGLAGYGMNITGISCITRGGKDLFHDGEQKGVTYTEFDNYYLDGKRLILEAGIQGKDGSKYSLEGDPYTNVYLHSKMEAIKVYVYEPEIVDKQGRKTMEGYYQQEIEVETTYFEVKSSSGIITQYGNTHDSRFVLRNLKGFPEKTIAWYVNQEKDKYSNIVEYCYYDRDCDSRSGNDGTPVYNDNLVVRPKCIRYGLNDKESRNISNTINFEYRSLGNNARSIAVAGRTGKMDVCLESITTKTNNDVFRKYTFAYDGTSDATPAKWNRLVSVTESNGIGEKYKPVSISWNSMRTANIGCDIIQTSTNDDRTYYDETHKSFFTADLNGDGISDIIRISSVDVGIKTKNYKSYSTYPIFYISLSKKNDSGEISYETQSPIQPNFTIGSLDAIKKRIGQCTCMDLNGDGYVDVLIPLHNQYSGEWNQDLICVIYGGCSQCSLGSILNNLETNDSSPLYASCDLDGDGMGEIICLEKKTVNSEYPCRIIKKDTNPKHIPVKLSENPEKIFLGDFNNDGLTDLIILHDNGYKIYYNNGGKDLASLFPESNSLSITGNDVLKDHWFVEQGDFNGDGLTDFVYNIGKEANLFIALNDGNGKFKITKQIDNIGFTSNRDDKFSMHVLDFNHDGCSDIVISRSDRKTLWIESSAEGKLSISQTFDNAEKPGHIFQGDFDGDGYVEIACFGACLCCSSKENAGEGINVCKYGGNDLTQFGKIESITDGMDNKSKIQYAVATDPSVYTCDKSRSSYPVNVYTIPLSVVKQIKSDCGSVQTTNYKYEDLMIHIGGRGMLGFNRTYSNNTTMGTEQTTEVTDWDKSRWLPKKVRSTSKVGTETSVSNSEYTFAPVHGNYFAYVSKSIATDLDGNSVSTITQYIDSIGVIEEQTVYNDDEQMYKKTSYKDYVKKGGMYLPAKMIMEQKHRDFSTPYSSTTSYVYDDLGQVIKQTVNDETDMALSTEYTYDSWGNVTSTKSLVAGDKEIVSYNEYDKSGRFVTKSFTLPASSVNTYTYDIWGNVLTETDETNASNHLTIKHKYDGWGREIETIDAAGIKTQYSIAWDSSNNKKYHTVEKTDNFPSVTTWYDKAGRKVEQSSFGQKGVSITKTWTYNYKGQVFQKGNHTGNLHIVDTYIYDNRGRVVSETSNTGKSGSYSYGNRSVTTTIGNRTYTKTSDAWGNIIKSIDPDGTEVRYLYHSNGQPKTIESCKSIVSIGYDEAGNQISLSDPDAGKMTYSYAPDGSLLTQKDNRGIETINTYDYLGRIQSSKTGDKTINYEYGTSGNDNMRLKSLALDGNKIEYEYDPLGRVIKELRTISGQGAFISEFEYNNKNQLVKTIYPGNLRVEYRYDENGFKTQILANGQVVCEPISYDGKNSQTKLLNSLTITSTRNDKGYPNYKMLSRESCIKEQFRTDYDILTDNLLSRQRNTNPLESFTYDKADRLTAVKRGDEVILSMDYAANGNINKKSDVGDYTYTGTSMNKPHAVKSIWNQPDPLPSSLLNTTFNAWGKIENITLDKYTGNVSTIDVVYGPDQERWYLGFDDNKGVARTIIYAGNYEKVTENGVTREFYYLDGNMIVVKQNGVFTPYLAFKDNLGSFLSIWDAEGEKVFDADYDAWGKQEVHLNDVGFQRGYTGHEMWNEFDIINMNGRLYDPTIARFLSPDNYVQAPDNSQSFNRYSYCLNNPLKYTDPSGNFFTWHFGKGGFSFGLNFTWIGIPLGFGLNVGSSGSIGVYGEAGPRVGGTGFGSGATVSTSVDYNMMHNYWTSTTSESAYASFGLFNAGGSYSQTYDFGSKSWSTGWNISVGIGFGNEESSIGISASYGSDGWSWSIGGCEDNHAWDDYYEYDPDLLNENSLLCMTNNCYSYALGEYYTYSDHGLQPGFQTGYPLLSITLENTYQCAMRDGYIKKPNFIQRLGFGKRGYYEVYLVSDDYHDYHWYRRDKGGFWSQKHGIDKVTNIDGSGRLIKNPAKANHNYNVVNYNDGGLLLWVKKRN